MAGMRPTQRTLDRLRTAGMEADVVERFIKHAGPHGMRRDLYGIIDVLAISPQRTLGVQCCAASGHAAHRDKIRSEPRTMTWLAGGRELELWSWGKYKLKRGGKAIRWRARVEKFYISMDGELLSEEGEPV